MTHIAPAPSEVNWKSLGLSPRAKACRTALVNAIVFLLVLFWTIPVAFVSSLIAIESLERE